MKESEQKTIYLHNIDFGVLVTVTIAIIGFAFWLGKLQTQIDRVDADKLKREFDAKVADAISKSVVPRGTIIAWFSSSETLPIGWVLCDGSVGSGTPNLSGRFLRGSTNFKEVGNLGGSETHTHLVGGDGGSYPSAGNMVTGITAQRVVAKDATNLPPYVDIIFIMKQ